MELQTKRVRLYDAYPDLAREYAQRLHRKKEDFEFVQKFFVSDKAESSEADRAVIAYISTATTDRDNEVLLPKGMKSEHYEKSGKPVFWGHSYSEPRDVIGQCQWLKPSAKGIVAKTAFRNNEFSDEVYQLYTEDLTGQGPILRGWSVGFIPLQWESGKKEGDPRRTYTEWELLEFSAVSIPCNPDAQTILGQKGIKLCDRLKKDLGLGEPGPVALAEPPADVVEEMAPDPAPVAKIFDLDKNPSMSDVYGAVWQALNPPAMLEKPGSISTYRDIWDLYPVDYPSGHCVYAERQEDGSWLGYQVDYAYDNGAVTLGENPVPVAPGYVRRRGKGMDVTRLNEATDRLMALTAKVQEVLDKAKATPAPLAEARVDPPLPPDPDDFIEIDEPENILDSIEPAKPAVVPAPEPKALTLDEAKASIASAIAGLDLTSIVDKSIKDNLDRLRGRVR